MQPQNTSETVNLSPSSTPPDFSNTYVDENTSLTPNGQSYQFYLRHPRTQEILTCLLDRNDLEVVKGRKLRLCKDGYVVFACTYLEYLAPTLIGKPPQGMVIDHINRVRTDNRRCNLRFATRAENAQNCSVKRNSESGVKGVAFRFGRYYVRARGRSLGGFATLEEARECYDTWIKCNHPQTTTNAQLL